MAKPKNGLSKTFNAERARHLRGIERTFREEVLERLTSLENGRAELERRFNEGQALMRERVEGIQVALGNRIEELKADIVRRLEEIHFSVRSQAIPLARRMDLQDKTIAKLDRWYNRHAGALGLAAWAISVAAIIVGAYLARH